MSRIKTYLCSTMTQSRLNKIMVLHIHNRLTDKIDHTSVLNEHQLMMKEENFSEHFQ